MRKVAEIKEYVIYEFWYSYYIFYKFDGAEVPDGRFNSLEEAIDYVKMWIK